MSAEVNVSSKGPGAADSASTAQAYPRTRSQTKSLPVLKRKGSDITRARLSKPAKIARAEPSLSATPSEDTSPEAAVDTSVDSSAVPAAIRTMWPPEVPRSMLFTFRVGPSPFQVYDGAKRTSALDVSPSSDAAQFLATGSEPMFDHSWRVSFVESAQSKRQRVNAALATEETRIHNHLKGFDAPADAPSQRPSASSRSAKTAPAGSVLRSLRRDDRVRDENMFPMVRGLELVRVGVPQRTEDEMYPLNGDHPTPLSPSRNLAQNRQRDDHPFANHHSLFHPPVPLVAFNDSLIPITERTSPGGATFPTYAPMPSSAPSLLFSGVPSGIGRGEPRSFSGPHPILVRGPTPIHRAQPVPLMTPSNTTLRAVPSFQPVSGSSVMAEPSSHEPHIPMFSLPPHAGWHLLQPPPAYSHLGHYQPTQLPAVPHARPLLVGLGTHVTHPGLAGNMSSSAVPPPHYPPSCGRPQGATSPITLSPPVIRLPPSGGGAPWSMFYECIKNGRNALRGSGKGKRRHAPENTTESAQVQLADRDLSRLEAAVDARTTGPSHRCPFCPRTFSLANGLAIHLKWHWGATGLEWKRGISRTGRTIDRALRDAERRREDAARQQDQLDFPGIPPSISTSCSPSNPQGPTRPPNESTEYSFMMPVMARSSSNPFDFPVYSSYTSTQSDLYPSSTDAQYSHAFQPPMRAAPSSSYGLLPHTPELLADTGSTNSASTGRSSPTWSENLFGYGIEDADVDADAEGDTDYDDDLFGNHHLELRCDTAGDVDAGLGSAVRASDRICRERGGGLAGGRRRAVSVRVRPLFLRAPRLAPLRLPAAFFDDDDDDDDVGVDDVGVDDQHVSVFRASANGGEDDDDPFTMRGFSAPSDGLAPLYGLPPLQALPELDAAFQHLSVF